MHNNTTVALKPNFVPCVMCCISLNMHFFQSLLKFKIIIIVIPEDLLLIFLVSNADYMLICHAKALPKTHRPSDCITLYV